jgi:hypothetical protein
MLSRAGPDGRSSSTASTGRQHLEPGHDRLGIATASCVVLLGSDGDPSDVCLATGFGHDIQAGDQTSLGASMSRRLRGKSADGDSRRRHRRALLFIEKLHLPGQFVIEERLDAEIRNGLKGDYSAVSPIVCQIGNLQREPNCFAVLRALDAALPAGGCGTRIRGSVALAAGTSSIGASIRAQALGSPTRVRSRFEAGGASL